MCSICISRGGIMTFWFGAVYKSTKLDCSPSNWDNKPVFDLGFRNHIILWGGFNFFLVLAKPLHSYSFKRIVCLCCVLSKIHTKIKRMHLKPVPSYCHVLISVLSTTFCDNLKPSLIFPLWVLPVLILFLFFLGNSYFSTWPCVGNITYFLIYSQEKWTG